MDDINCWETKFKYCYYSKRLLVKLLLINKTAKPKTNISEVKKAIYYAKKYHGDQKRQSGEPYYSHPIEVAYLITKYAVHCTTTDILVTSILHDTLEDTNLTKEIICYIFGSVIAEQVEDLTRIKNDRKISSAEMVDLLLLQNKYDLLLIKIFDRLHNLLTLAVKPLEKIQLTVEETGKKFISLSIYLDAIMIIPNLRLDTKITKLCGKYLPIRHNVSVDLRGFCEDTFRLPFPDFQNEELQTYIL